MGDIADVSHRLELQFLGTDTAQFRAKKRRLRILVCPGMIVPTESGRFDVTSQVLIARPGRLPGAEIFCGVFGTPYQPYSIRVRHR